MFAAAADDAYFTHTFQVFEKCARDALFCKRFGLFAARADLDESRPGEAHAVAARDGRVLQIIDVLDMNLRREILVSVKNPFRLIEVTGLVYVGDGRVLFQTFDDFLRFLRKCKPLVTGGVEALVVAVSQPVDEHQGSNHDNRVKSCHRTVTRLALRERIMARMWML